MLCNTRSALILALLIRGHFGRNASSPKAKEPQPTRWSSLKSLLPALTRKHAADGHSLPAHRPEKDSSGSDPRSPSVAVVRNVQFVRSSGLGRAGPVDRSVGFPGHTGRSAAYPSPYRLPCLLLHCLQSAVRRAAAGLLLASVT